jgi:uncharacterized protein (UPF0305 family)
MTSNRNWEAHSSQCTASDSKRFLPCHSFTATLLSHYPGVEVHKFMSVGTELNCDSEYVNRQYKSNFIEMLWKTFVVLTALESKIQAKLPPFSIVHHRNTMIDRRTVSGLKFLTALLFETVSSLHFHHLPFLNCTSPNTVHPIFVTAIEVQVNHVML